MTTAKYRRYLASGEPGSFVETLLFSTGVPGPLFNTLRRFVRRSTAVVIQESTPEVWEPLSFEISLPAVEPGSEQRALLTIADPSFYETFADFGFGEVLDVTYQVFDLDAAAPIVPEVSTMFSVDALTVAPDSLLSLDVAVRLNEQKPVGTFFDFATFPIEAF